jgi:hypothetical protein
VEFEGARAFVTYDPKMISVEDVSNVVSGVGYTATPSAVG